MSKEYTNTDHAMAEIVNAFLRWPLPQSVCSDRCVTQSDYPHPRSGTNLLTCPETVGMVQEVIRPVIDRLLEEETAKLRSALVRTTGSLGLIIKGSYTDTPGHKQNYEHARTVLVETEPQTPGPESI